MVPVVDRVDIAERLLNESITKANIALNTGLHEGQGRVSILIPQHEDRHYSASTVCTVHFIFCVSLGTILQKHTCIAVRGTDSQCCCVVNICNALLCLRQPHAKPCTVFFHLPFLNEMVSLAK